MTMSLLKACVQIIGRTGCSLYIMRSVFLQIGAGVALIFGIILSAVIGQSDSNQQIDGKFDFWCHCSKREVSVTA
jgi:hypothetical protein